jgi:uncharacterized protein YoxC
VTGDVLRICLSVFLILVGVGLAYVCLRLAGLFERTGVSVTRVTDEVVPILSKAQVTMDGVNRELDRVDEIMVSAVHGVKGAEQAVTTVSNAVTAPVRKATGFAAAAREAVSTFRARRASGTPPPAATTRPRQSPYPGTPPPGPPPSAVTEAGQAA